MLVSVLSRRDADDARDFTEQVRTTPIPPVD